MTREEAIKELQEAHNIMRSYDIDSIESRLMTALNMAIKALEQEPSGDLISKQVAIDIIESWLSCDDYNEAERHIMRAMQSVLYDLPSVKQEPKTGHWIEKDGFDGDVYYDCSECGESWTTIEGTPWQNGMAYCPNCGARMVGEEDVSQ